MFRKLERLEQQGFIAKRYFENQRLLHKPVPYYLLPAGARKLSEYRDEGDADNINIKSIYRDNSVHEPFAMHCLSVFDLYNRLMATYGDDLNFLSKSDQVNFDSLPRPLPDAYLTLETETTTRHFFLDILNDDTHLVVDASKKIRRYINYQMSGEWTDEASPAMVFVCNSASACVKVQKLCVTAVSKTWAQDVDFRVFTPDSVNLNESRD